MRSAADSKIDFFLAVGRRVPRDAARDEFGIEPVVALLEIAAVRHLREDVGAAEQVADQPVLGIDADLLDRHLVAGEVQRARGVRREIAHAELDEVVLEKAPAARDVRLRVLGAVGVPRVLAMTDVAAVVVQRGHDAEAEQTLGEHIGMRSRAPRRP